MCPVWLELSSYLSIGQSMMNFKAELFYVFLNFMASYIMSNWGIFKSHIKIVYIQEFLPEIWR